MSNMSRPVVLKQVLCDVVCAELTLTSWCVTALAFIVVDGVSELEKNKTYCDGSGIRFFLFFFGKCCSHLHNSVKHLCTWVRGTLDKGLCQIYRVILGQGDNGWFDRQTMPSFSHRPCWQSRHVSWKPLACLLHPSAFLIFTCAQPLPHIDMFCFSFCLTLNSFTQLLFFSFLLTLQVEAPEKLVYFFFSLTVTIIPILYYSGSQLFVLCFV